VLSFIDGINRGDVDRLAALMTDDHQLLVYDEAPVSGRAANVEAWRGYVESFPDYVVVPHRIVERASGYVAALGHTTGSHLGLPDDEERELLVIWEAEVVDGRLRTWLVNDDTPARRAATGLDDGD
jgi:ketosteroid isomerase-like protein